MDPVDIGPPDARAARAGCQHLALDDTPRRGQGGRSAGCRQLGGTQARAVPGVRPVLAARAAYRSRSRTHQRQRNRAAPNRLTHFERSNDLMRFKTIGTIGAGPIARAVATHATKAGHRVLLSNNHGPETLGDVVDSLGPNASAVSFDEAVTADIILLAVPFVAVPEVARRLPDWSGRVVVDMTNQFAEVNPYRGFADVSPLTGSEWVAQHLPGAVIIKAFNSMFATYAEAEPRHQEGAQVVFFAGDDAPSKHGFAQMVAGLGFAPIDLGTLRDGGALMQLGGALSGKHFLFQG
ncbi:NADPH-dependent F420 reductase [Streptomyces sp. NPDC091292]|uniref:NADPH-dependent F420 reductase n=1 Tax=Streptomyces sp. NPDC091292 TaxID=3365991 RepID=UPI00382EF205